MTSTARYFSLLAMGAATAVFGESPPFVKIEKTAPVNVARGGSAEASVTVKVNDGFHVQANPASQRQLIATELALEPPAGLETGKPLYPPGKPWKLQGTMEISTYSGLFPITVPVKAKTAKAGKYTLPGKLRYQACNETTCFPPQREPVAIEIQVK